MESTWRLSVNVSMFSSQRIRCFLGSTFFIGAFLAFDIRKLLKHSATAARFDDPEGIVDL